MLGNALWICSAIALVIGAAHALYVYRQEIGEFKGSMAHHSRAIRIRAGYYALWTLILWLLLGATVVAYWIIALIPYLIARAIQFARGPRVEAEQGAGMPP